MLRPPPRLLAIVAALVLAACHDDATITGTDDVVASFSHVVRGPGKQTFHVLEGQLPAQVRAVSKVIGPEGGELVLHGPPTQGQPRFHALTVPAGAVKEPLLFVMELSGGTHIEVDLNAYRVNARNRPEVGHRGFAKPLSLTLSWAFAEDAPDPRRLSIVHLVGNAVKEQVPSRAHNGKKKVVVGELRHFSRYAVAAE